MIPRASGRTVVAIRTRIAARLAIALALLLTVSACMTTGNAVAPEEMAGPARYRLAIGGMF